MSTAVPNKFLQRGRASRPSRVPHVSHTDAADERWTLRIALRRWLLARWAAACRRAEDPQRHVPYY